jgi:hypothetical protein
MKDLRTIANTDLSSGRVSAYPKKKAPEPIPCRECGEMFLQSRPWQVFCSDDCKKSWHANVYKRQIEEAEKAIARLERENAQLKEELRASRG